MAEEEQEKLQAKDLADAIMNAELDKIKKIINKTPNIISIKINGNIKRAKVKVTPIQRALSCFMQAKKDKKDKIIEIIKFLFEKGADSNEKSDFNGGQTPLEKIANSSANLELLKILFDNGATEYSSNLLASLIKKSKIGALKLFFKRNNENATTKCESCYPIHQTAKAKSPNLNMLKLLIKKFGNKQLNIKNKNGETPLHIFLKKVKDKEKLVDKEKNYLEKIITNENIEIRDNKGHTPLAIAFMSINTNLRRILIKYGANRDFNYQNNTGKGYLHFAIEALSPENINTKNITFLIKNGFYVNKKDTNGNTPLHMLDFDVKYSPFANKIPEDLMINIFKLFLQNGANINIKNKNNETIALRVAKENHKILKEQNYSATEYQKYNYKKNYLNLLKFLILNGAEILNFQDSYKLITELRKAIVISPEKELLKKHLYFIIKNIKFLDSKFQDTEKEIKNDLEMILKLRSKDSKILLLQLLENEITIDEIDKNYKIDKKLQIKVAISEKEYDDILKKKQKAIKEDHINYTDYTDYQKKLNLLATKKILKRAHDTYNKNLKIFSFSPNIKMKIFSVFALLESQKIIRITSKKWLEYLRILPFNYEFFHKKEYGYLRNKAFMLQKRNHTIKIVDINGTTLYEAALNYPHYINLILSHRPDLFFSNNSMDLNEPDQLKPILKKILANDLSEKEKEDHPFAKKITERILPLNIDRNTNISHRSNYYHRTFLNRVTMITLLQNLCHEKFNEKGLSNKINSYINDSDLFDKKTYIPSRDFFPEYITEEE